MRRREFITLVGGAVLFTTALRATAQTAKIPRVGILSPASSEEAATLAAFRKGIRDLSYVEGPTIVLDFRVSKGDYDVLPALAVQLVRVPVDVIVTDSISATQAAASATRTIPIVMAASGGDPVAMGLAASLNKPGGNVTGVLFLSVQLSEERLQLLKFPAITRVAVLFNPTSAIGPPSLRATEQAAKLLGITINPIAVSSPAELRAPTPATLAGSKGFIGTADAMLWNNRATILALASSARIPALYSEREYADEGGLIAYGANVPDHFRQAAGYVDRILRGDKPGDLPINASSKMDFVVNLRTARALGLAISPDFLSSANEVIE